MVPARCSVRHPREPAALKPSAPPRRHFGRGRVWPRRAWHCSSAPREGRPGQPAESWLFLCRGHMEPSWRLQASCRPGAHHSRVAKSDVQCGSQNFMSAALVLSCESSMTTRNTRVRGSPRTRVTLMPLTPVQQEADCLRHGAPTRTSLQICPEGVQCRALGERVLWNPFKVTHEVVTASHVNEIVVPRPIVASRRPTEVSAVVTMEGDDGTGNSKGSVESQRIRVELDPSHVRTYGAGGSVRFIGRSGNAVRVPGRARIVIDP